MAAMKLPIIDISVSSTQVAKDLVEAVSNHGFVYIKNVNAGLSGEPLQSMFSLAKQFFDSPPENKTPCAVNSTDSGKNSGWFGMNVETLDPSNQRTGDFKEAFNMNEFVNGKAQQPLPEPLKSRESQMHDFIVKCHDLCLRILQLLAVGLEIDEAHGGKDWFSSRHDKALGSSGSVFRLLYYPQLNLDSKHDFDLQKDIRAGAHSDYGTITLLFQKDGQPGLEILTGNNTESWSPVPVNPTSEQDVPILVNVGDLLSYWTNGMLKSTVHRVVFPHNGSGEDRYSIAYFCHPLDDAKLEAIPSKMIEDWAQETRPSTRTARGDSMTAKEHLEARLRATYG